MTAYVSVLMLRSPEGRLDEALTQFMGNRVLETCRDVIPGFLSGRLLRATEDPNQACVICEWVDRAAFEQWMTSPHRRSSAPGRVFEPSARSQLFELVQDMRR